MSARHRRLLTSTVALLGAGVMVAGCTGNTPEASSSGGGGNNAASSNVDTGDT
ncbi:MAG: sugar ABC transporter substrate-binding protein, partial [Actinobacteria bacterium]|nr:sugar ABC transporter substrate-binding protein [Actinomycetota bacterium]